MKRILRFLLCFVVFIAVAGAGFALLFGVIGEEYYQEGSLLRNAFKMVPLVLLLTAWHYTADKLDSANDGVEPRDASGGDDGN